MTSKNAPRLERLVLSSLVFALLLLAAACGSSSTPTTPSTSGSPPTQGGSGLARGSMSGNISGTAWTATIGVTATLTNGLLAVGGNDPTNNLAFAFFVNGPGTYAIPGSGAGVGNNALLLVTTSGTTNASYAADFTKGSGSLTITSLTSTAVTGTFTFTLNAVANTAASGTRTITNGAFNINF